MELSNIVLSLHTIYWQATYINNYLRYLLSQLKTRPGSPLNCLQNWTKIQFQK